MSRQINGASRRNVLKKAGAAAGAALAMTQVSRVAAAQDMDPTGLTGSWLVTNAVPGSPPNATLVTFIPGGAFIRSGNLHLSETPGHGAWKQVGDSEFEITYMTLQFDKEGNWIGHRKSWLHATVDASGMKFTARTRGATIDRNGVETPGAGGIGGNMGVRMVAEPFEVG
jgi:hypothetical protein